MTPSDRDLLSAPGPLLLLPEAVLLPEGPVDGWAVVVGDGRFEAVGPAAELERAHSELTPVRLPGRLLMPGFVDAHHHLTQSFGAALAFGEPSEIFRRVWVPLEGALDEESAYVAAKLAALEALRGGFTTVADAGTRAGVDVDVVASAARDAGIRCVLGLVCNDAGDPGGAGTPDPAVLENAEKHLARYADDPLVHASLAVSIPEAATEGPCGPPPGWRPRPAPSCRSTSTSTSRAWNAPSYGTGCGPWSICTASARSARSSSPRTPPSSPRTR